MNFSIKATATALTLAMSTSSAFADGHLEGAIKARQGLMQLYSSNIGQLGAMAKGAVDYDAKAAMAAANNLLLLSTYDQSALWPQGSDSDSVASSNSLGKIWTTFPAIGEKGKAFAAAAQGMADAAGTDLAALRGAIGPLGASCKGCHETYRKPK